MIKLTKKFLSGSILLLFCLTIVFTSRISVQAATSVPLTGVEILSYSYSGLYQNGYYTENADMVVYGNKAYINVHFAGQSGGTTNIFVDGVNKVSPTVYDVLTTTVKNPNTNIVTDFYTDYAITGLTSGTHTIAVNARASNGIVFGDRITITVVADTVMASQQNVPTNKTWAIVFTQPLSLTNNFQQCVKVVKMFGENATPVSGLTYSLSADAKTLYVSAPVGGYNVSQLYNVIVNSNILNSNNVPLGHRVLLPFTTSSAKTTSILNTNLLQSSTSDKSTSNKPTVGDFTVSWDK